MVFAMILAMGVELSIGMAPLDQTKVYGIVPEDALALNVTELPLQAAIADDCALAVGKVFIFTAIELVAVQLLLSVTVTVYVMFAIMLAVGVELFEGVAPEDQL